MDQYLISIILNVNIVLFIQKSQDRMEMMENVMKKANEGQATHARGINTEPSNERFNGEELQIKDDPLFGLDLSDYGHIYENEVHIFLSKKESFTSHHSSNKNHIPPLT